MRFTYYKQLSDQSELNSFVWPILREHSKELTWEGGWNYILVNFGHVLVSFGHGGPQ